MENEKNFLDLCRRYGQDALLGHYSSLEPAGRRRFLAGLRGIDLESPLREYRRLSGAQEARETRLEPAPVIGLEEAPLPRKAARERGLSLLRDGRVAVLVVAGGQGTRLGLRGPKGTCPVSPVRDKTLFQLLVEQVLARARQAGRPIPLLVMTSRENRAPTESFFEKNDRWGLSRDDLFFFEQGVVPTLTPAGELVLAGETSLAVNPDGHGGVVEALGRAALAPVLAARGIEKIFYCQVDNPLVRVADPEFLGFHDLAGAGMSLKVVRRRDESEKVGLFGLVDGRPAVAEYSDLPPETMAERDGAGQLRHWAGSIAVHAFDLSFLERLFVELDGGLPWHRAVKQSEAWTPRGARPITGWKFERFIFDALPLARAVSCVETDRSEFAPVKNRSGLDSPETAARAMSELHREWLAEAGRPAPDAAAVEISPLFCPDRESLPRALAGRPGLPEPGPRGLYLE